MSRGDVVNGFAVGAEFSEGEGMSEWVDRSLMDVIWGI